MKRVNQYQFYQLGFAVHPLTEVTKDTPIEEIYGNLILAQSWLDYFVGDNVTPLVTCRSTAERLLAAVAKVIPKRNSELPPEEAQKDWGSQMARTVGWFDAFQMSNAAKEFETIFAAELENTDTYYVSDKGIYATPKLIESADLMFSEDIRSVMPEQAIVDIRQAGRCLAFDLDTAAGFHMVRAAESLIHEYYVVMTGSTLRRKDRNWGAYVRNLNAHLRKIPTASIDRKLIALIDQVREHHRNPVMHPEVVLDANEALTLFNICQSVIVSIAIPLRKANAQQLQLKVVNSTP